MVAKVKVKVLVVSQVVFLTFLKTCLEWEGSKINKDLPLDLILDMIFLYHLNKLLKVTKLRSH